MFRRSSFTVPIGTKLPAICLRCGRKTTGRAWILDRVERELEFPLCDACAGRSDLRASLVAIGALVLFAVLASVAHLPALACLVALCGLIAALVTHRRTAIVVRVDQDVVRITNAHDAVRAAYDAALERPGRASVVGKRCVACKARIVVETDGASCSHCNEPVHRDGCLTAHQRSAHSDEAPTPYR